MGKIKDKVEIMKYKAKKTARNCLKWVEENKELSVVLIPIAATALGGSFKLARDISRKHDIHKQKMLKTHYIYDPVTGAYLKTRKSLNNRDAIRLAQLRKGGLTVTEALNDMGLL